MVTQLKDRSNWRAVSGALVFVILGLVFLWLSETKWLADSPAAKGLFGQLGGLLLASVAIAFIWEFFSKRALMEEMLDKAQIAQDVHRSGLDAISLFPLKAVDYTRLIKESMKIDIQVSYGGSWRTQNEWELREFAKRSGARIRVILSNPDNNQLLAELARRYGKSNEQIAHLIREAVDDYKRIFSVKGGAKLEIWVHDKPPVYSCFRFDNKIVITTYRYQEGRGQVPTLVCSRGGEYFDFFKGEIEHFFESTEGCALVATQVHVSPDPKA